MIMLVVGIKKMENKTVNLLSLKKKIQVIFFFMFFVNSLCFFSQEKNYETLIQQISDKAWEAIVEEKDSGIYYSNKIIEVSIAHKDSYNEMLGYQYRGIYNEAVLNYYEKAIKDYLKAISIAEKSHKDFVPDMHIEIGILFQKTGDDNKALAYLEKAVDLSEKNSITHFFAALSLANTQSKLKNYKKAYKNYTFFIKQDSLTQEDKEEAYLGLARNFSRQNKYKKAQENYLKSIKADSLKGKLRYAAYYSDIINNAIKMKNADTINKYLKPLKKSFSSVSALRERLKYFESTANAYKALKNFKKASDYQDSTSIVKDLLVNRRYNKIYLN